MKLTITFFLISLATFAQHHFKYEKNLQWQHLYNTAITPEALTLELKKAGFEAYLEEGIVNFYRSFTTEDLKTHGYTTMNYPIYIGNGGNFKGIIEFKEGSYRVTVTSIEVFDSVFNKYEAIDGYLIKNKTIKTAKNHQKVITTLDLFFTEIFKIKPSAGW